MQKDSWSAAKPKPRTGDGDRRSPFRREAERFFGVPMGRRGMQPVWLSIENQSSQAYRLRLASLDRITFRLWRRPISIIFSFIND